MHATAPAPCPCLPRPTGEVIKGLGLAGGGQQEVGGAACRGQQERPGRGRAALGQLAGRQAGRQAGSSGHSKGRTKAVGATVELCIWLSSFPAGSLTWHRAGSQEEGRRGARHRGGGGQEGRGAAAQGAGGRGVRHCRGQRGQGWRGGVASNDMRQARPHAVCTAAMHAKSAASQEPGALLWRLTAGAGGAKVRAKRRGPAGRHGRGRHHVVAKGRPGAALEARRVCHAVSTAGAAAAAAPTAAAAAPTAAAAAAALRRARSLQAEAPRPKPLWQAPGPAVWSVQPVRQAANRTPVADNVWLFPANGRVELAHGLQARPAAVDLRRGWGPGRGLGGDCLVPARRLRCSARRSVFHSAPRGSLAMPCRRTP